MASSFTNTLSNSGTKFENEISARKYALIVDDDQSTLEVYDLALADLGFIPILTSDSTKAIENARMYRPAVVLLDQRMPGLTGIELTRHLRGEGDFQGPIIIVSAGERLKEEALEAGATAVLEKPFEVEELIRTIDSLTEHNQARTA